MVLTLWWIRDRSEGFDPVQVYGNNVNVFSLKINHGGVFIKNPVTRYAGGKVDHVDMIDSDAFSVIELNAMIQEIGYPKEQLMFYHFLIPEMELNFGLRPIANDQDTLLLLQYLPRFKVIELFTEQWSSSLGIGYNLKSPTKNSHVVSEELIEPHQSKQPALEWRDDSEGKVNENEVVEDEVMDDDDDRMEDNDNMVEDVNVDMDAFKANILDDLDDRHHVEDGNEDDLECDLDDFESGSEDDDGNLLNIALRKYRKRKKKSTNLDAIPFSVGQSFTNKDDIKNLVKSHAVQSRRQLHIQRNETYRFRVVCLGINPVFVSGGENCNKVEIEREKCLESGKLGGTQSVGESSQLGGTTSCTKKSKNSRRTPTCPWALHLSRKESMDTWLVKTFNQEHICLQTREVRLYTVSSIAKEIEQTIESNPGIPLKALQEQIQKKHQVQVGLQKIFRAKMMAINKVHGDYTAQYLLLRDYCDELRRSNPGTTVKLDVERECNLASETRQFRRIYICYGALKAAFKLSGREILGLDGCFMKGPYPGQILTAVSVDANNGIYPVAFAIVESECTSSWTWFLENLGDDLDLYVNSNFTFISDRQKGIIPAIHKLYPAAEHRYCLRHIHENMKSRWRGNLYKELLWKSACATTIPQFNKYMEAIKSKDPALHKWLQDIPPKHWARSHFSGRSKCDVLLNNLCEVFNKQLVGGRDKPIITCLEYIREYMMRRISVVNKMIAKCNGPLTPTATRTFNQIKDEASQYIVIFNGQNKYQVTGPWNDQCVVNTDTRTCSCRKWELTGMPCKHAVAVNWDMIRHGVQVGLPESWVDEVYWLDTWKKVYKNTIDPINGRDLWTPSACPSSLLPPKHRVQVGRPKKARKKSAAELSQRIDKDGKLTRQGGSVTCGTCKKAGHNKRRCSSQATPQPSEP